MRFYAQRMENMKECSSERVRIQLYCLFVYLHARWARIEMAAWRYSAVSLSSSIQCNESIDRVRFNSEYQSCRRLFRFRFYLFLSQLKRIPAAPWNTTFICLVTERVWNVNTERHLIECVDEAAVAHSHVCRLKSRISFIANNHIHLATEFSIFFGFSYLSFAPQLT